MGVIRLAAERAPLGRREAPGGRLSTDVMAPFWHRAALSPRERKNPMPNMNQAGPANSVCEKESISYGDRGLV
jgi:hypothetical protein